MKRLLARKLSQRTALLLVALGLAASVVSGREKRDLAEPARAPVREAPSAETAALADALDPARLRRAPVETEIADLFAPPPSPAQPGSPAVSSAPAAPVAPPLPFRYLARIVDGGRTTVFLANGEHHYPVEPGQVIDRAYRVERVTGTAVTFIHLPSGTRQVLAVPALN